MSEVTVRVPAGVDQQTARRAALRAVEVIATLGQVEVVLGHAGVLVGPGHLAQAALREGRWRDVESTWGMLTGAEVATLTGNKSQNARSVTANLRRRQGLAGVKRHGALRYPGFQFVPGSDGTFTVAPTWAKLRDLMAAAQWSDAELLAWAAAPNAWLDGRSPAQEVQDRPDQVSEELMRAAVKALPPGVLGVA